MWFKVKNREILYILTMACIPKMVSPKGNILESAAQQTLSEVLGYDEGKAYYLLLSKKEEELEKEFSYSKRYRLLKNLYNLGAVGKLKPEDQDFFGYVILPPSFLYSRNISSEIIDFLEKIYLKNHSEILNSSFSQLILKNENGFLTFILKYFMKESARIITNETGFNKILGKNINKVDMIEHKKESKRRMGIIDRNYAFEFTDMLNKDTYESVGYFAKTMTSSERDYISLVEKEMREF